MQTNFTLRFSRIFLLLLLFFISPGAFAQTFVHPGLPFTTADLNQLKAHLTTEPWATAYAAFANDARSKLTYTMQGPFTTVGRAQDINLGPWQNDMTAVRNLAFMWIFTGDTAYAQKATNILNTWAITNTKWTGDETFLTLGDYADKYVTGADILKSTYSGWTPTNTINVNNYFANVLWPEADVPHPVRGLNQGAIQLKIAISIAAFLDDPVKWQQALDVYRGDAGGGLANSLGNGEVGDAGRDEGHWAGQADALAWSAEVAWKQGVDLFAESGNRLLAISELYTKFNIDTTGLYSKFIPFGGTYAYYTGFGATGGARRQLALYNIIYNAYTLRKGIPAPSTAQLRDLVGENSTSFFYRKTADNSTATPPAPIVHPISVAVTSLTNIDIGSTGLAGSAGYSAGTWTVKGAGADIPVPPLTAKDAFNFSFRQASGDAVIITRVTSVGNTNSSAKAGIMFRESLTDDSRYVGIFLHPVAGVDLTWRGATAWSKTAGSWNTPPGGYLNHYQPFAPWWLKLERLGNKVSAYHSADGINWTCLGVAEVPFSGTVYVGLCATSHNTSALSTSTFSDLAITNTSAAGSPVVTSATSDSATIDSAYQYAITAPGTPTSYHATGLPAGLAIDTVTGIISGIPTTQGTYQVTLAASNNNGTGTAMLMLYIFNNVAPAAPTGIALSNAGLNQVAVSWAASANTSSYNVKRSLTPGGPYAAIASGITVNAFTDLNAYPGHNYYVVTAMTGTLESEASAEAAIVLSPNIPSKPAVTNGNGQITLSWPAATGATHYNIKRSAVSGGPYVVIATGITATNYVDTALTNGAYYYYVISSVLDTLESANSVEELGVPGAVSANWSPTPASGNWNAATNWDGGMAPASPAILGFNSSDTTQLTNDITGLQVARITFNPGGSAFTMGGNAITTGNDITNKSRNAQVLNFGITLDKTLTVNADSGDVRLGGVMAGSGSLIKHGPSWLYISGANTYSGGTTVYDSKGGWGPNAPLAITGAGTGTSGTPISGPLGTGTIVLNGGALMNYGATLIYNNMLVQEGVTSYLYNFSGAFSMAGKLLGSGTVQHDGTVTAGLHLSGDNSGFTGTFISVNRSSNHRIRFDAASAGSANANWVLNNGFTDGQGLAFGTGTISFGALSGGGSFRNDGGGSPVISIGALNKNTTFSGVISSNIAVTKTGTGKLIFTGTNSYFGATTINAGTLLVNGPNGGINSAVTVNAGTFGGTGTSSAPITVATGAMLAPGNDSIGTFTTTGVLTLNEDATYAVELNSNNGTADKMTVNGVTLNNALLALTNLSAGDFPLGTSLTIVNNTGSAGVVGIFRDLPELSLVNINGFDFRITYRGGTGNDIVLLDDRTTPPMITSSDTARVIVGRPFSYTITAIKSPTRFHATGLPNGLSIDTSSGVISGTPGVPGIYAVTLSASNNTSTGTATLTLTVLSNIVTGLMVAGGDGKNIVEWDPILDLSYTVKRSLTGGSYTEIAYTATTRYIDTAVTNGSIYYYVVAARDTGVAYPNSQEVLAKPDISQYGYWKFDEATGTRGVDAWGANHATLASTAGRGAGYAGQALKLEGAATAYAFLPVGEVSTLNDFTIAAWVKMDAISTWMRVFDFGSGTSKYMFLTVQAGIVSGKSIVRYAIKNGGAEQSVNYNYTFPLNTWTHLAVTQSGNTCSLYINGTLVVTNTNITIQPAALGSTTQNYLGKSQFADPMFKGSIDEFKIYSKALSPAEITAALNTDQLVNLKVMYRDGDNAQTSNKLIRPYLKIVNADTIPIAYKTLTARYWFTAENYAGINSWIDYAQQLDSSKIKMQYVQLPAPYNGALGYIEYSFDSTTGNLAAGSNSGELKTRFANTDWGILNETDDYSYQNNIAYTFNNHITLYRNGVLVWGREPATATPVISLKAYYQNQNTSATTNTIRTYLKLNNEGNMPVSYKDISVRYWFTAEGTTALNYWIDYARLGAAKITGQFVKLSPVPDSADTYFELTVDSSAGTLYPLSSTGNMQYRIAKADRSAFNETNDYSYKPAAAFTENDHITVYYKGQLIFGTPPPSGANARYTGIQNKTTVTPALEKRKAIVYPNPSTGKVFFINPGNQFQDKDISITVYDNTGKAVLFKMVRQYKQGAIQMIFNRPVMAGLYMVQLNNLPAVKLVVE